jgi:hypothetical protein
MRELNDKDFDEIFKTRITEEFPEFEEESWRKMEEKLRKKDRKVIFFRIAAVALLVLSFGIGIYYNNQHLNGEVTAGTKTTVKKDGTVQNAPVLASTAPSNASTAVEQKDEKVVIEYPGFNRQDVKNVVKNTEQPVYAINNQTLQTAQNKPQSTETISTNYILQQMGTTDQLGMSITQPIQILPQDMAQVDKIEAVGNEKSDQPEKIKKARRKIPISLAFSAGPDFNSTSSLLGGKTNLAFGLAIGVGITKKLSLQTGIGYGHKNYKADPYEYTFNNPNAVNTVETITAACKVVEIPLSASLKVSENAKRSIDVSAGLSSYLMLKEDYVYTYYQNLNRPDRLVEAKMENKHILSVLDLSATYNIKLKNKKLALGIEPYVKIPLTGIGVGNVPLKSSGVSLKLRYDFSKN